MAVVTKSSTDGNVKGVRKGEAFVKDEGRAVYLDGAQMQYVVYQKGGFPVAYLAERKHAELLADAINATAHPKDADHGK